MLSKLLLKARTQTFKMSNFNFGGGGALGIFCDNSSENASNFGVKKSKMEEAQGKMPAKKRAALGVITNTTRVQPSRAAKQVKGQPF